MKKKQALKTIGRCVELASVDGGDCLVRAARSMSMSMSIFCQVSQGRGQADNQAQGQIRLLAPFLGLVGASNILLQPDSINIKSKEKFTSTLVMFPTQLAMSRFYIDCQ